MPRDLTIADWTAADWPAVQAIYREGIATQRATFETAVPAWDVFDADRLASPRLGAWRGEQLAAWSVLTAASRRHCYRGVAATMIYVAASERGRGTGRALLEAVVGASEAAGFWTLEAVMFACNRASVALHTACGFREVGRRTRIGQVGGVWHDTLLMERRSTSVQPE